MGYGMGVQGLAFRVYRGTSLTQSRAHLGPPLAPYTLKRREGSFVVPYRSTSLIRNTPLLGPYSRTILRDLWWS